MNNVQLAPHFWLSEFACKCGCDNHLKPAYREDLTKLAKALETLRDALSSKPIRITSGFRCLEHNKKVGGETQSQHCLGRAADIQVDGVEPGKVAALAKSIKAVGGVGVYRTWTHVDVRPRVADHIAQWDKTNDAA